jgi:hypothetical protein
MLALLVAMMVGCGGAAGAGSSGTVEPDPVASSADPYLDALERARIGLALRVRPFVTAAREDDAEGMLGHLRAQLADLQTLDSVCEREEQAQCRERIEPMITRLAATQEPQSDALLSEWETTRLQVHVTLLMLMQSHARATESAIPRVVCIRARVVAHNSFFELGRNLPAHAGTEDEHEGERFRAPEEAARVARELLGLARASLQEGNIDQARRLAAEVEVALSNVESEEGDEPAPIDDVEGYLEGAEDEIVAMLESEQERAARAEAVAALARVPMPDGGDLWLTDPPAALRAVGPTLGRLDGPLRPVRTELMETAERAVDACAGVTFVMP